MKNLCQYSASIQFPDICRDWVDVSGLVEIGMVGFGGDYIKDKLKRYLAKKHNCKQEQIYNVSFEFVDRID